MLSRQSHQRPADESVPVRTIRTLKGGGAASHLLHDGRFPLGEDLSPRLGSLPHLLQRSTEPLAALPSSHFIPPVNASFLVPFQSSQFLLSIRDQATLEQIRRLGQLLLQRMILGDNGRLLLPRCLDRRLVRDLDLCIVGMRMSARGDLGPFLWQNRVGASLALGVVRVGHGGGRAKKRFQYFAPLHFCRFVPRDPRESIGGDGETGELRRGNMAQHSINFITGPSCDQVCPPLERPARPILPW